RPPLCRATHSVKLPNGIRRVGLVPDTCFRMRMLPPFEKTGVGREVDCLYLLSGPGELAASRDLQQAPQAPALVSVGDSKCAAHDAAGPAPVLEAPKQPRLLDVVAPLDVIDRQRAIDRQQPSDKLRSGRVLGERCVSKAFRDLAAR